MWQVLINRSSDALGPFFRHASIDLIWLLVGVSVLRRIDSIHLKLRAEGGRVLGRPDRDPLRCFAVLLRGLLVHVPKVLEGDVFASDQRRLLF